MRMRFGKDAAARLESSPRAKVALAAVALACVLAVGIGIDVWRSTSGYADATEERGSAADEEESEPEAAGDSDDAGDPNAEEEEDVLVLLGVTYHDASLLDPFEEAGSLDALGLAVATYMSSSGLDAAEATVLEADAGQQVQSARLLILGVEYEFSSEGYGEWAVTHGDVTETLSTSVSEAEEETASVPVTDAEGLATVVGTQAAQDLGEAWAAWATAEGVENASEATVDPESSAPTADASAITFVIELDGTSYDASFSIEDGTFSFSAAEAGQ